VSLRIYDAFSNDVESLVQEEVPAGNYKVELSWGLIRLPVRQV